jgi:WD40 repeat protein
VNLAHADCRQTRFTQTFSGVTQVVFTPDSQQVAMGDMEGEVQLWQAQGGQFQQRFKAHRGWVWALACSPDGQLLATGGEDYTIHLWYTETGDCCHTLPTHLQLVTALAFSPDGKFLAISGLDPNIYVWEIGTDLLITLQGHEAGVVNVCFNSQGDGLFSTSFDNTTRQWCLDGYLDGHLDKHFDGHLDGHLNTKQCFTIFQAHNLDPYNLSPAMALSPDGTTLVQGTIEGNLLIWDVATGQCGQICQGHHQEIYQVNFHPQGRQFASSSADGTVRIWDRARGQCLQVLQGHDNIILTFAYSPNGQTLVSGSLDQKLIFWDVATGNCLKILGGYIDKVGVLAWQPNPTGANQSPWAKSLLASGSASTEIRLWDMERGCLAATLSGHKGYVTSVAWSPDGNYLASASYDRTIAL